MVIKAKEFDNSVPATASVMATKDITVRAKDSAAMLPYWDKTDAIVEGFDAVKAAGKEYLPMFSEEEQCDYDVRLSMAKFTNVYRDVLEGLATKPFEEEVTLVGDKESKAPDQIEAFIENVDGSGNNLTTFAAQTFFNGINSAIDWIFIDYPTVAPEIVRTVADAKALGVKPYWTHVLGRNVLEARTDIINGEEKLSYIRIFEPGMTGPDHVRIFTRQPDSSITWELWVKNDKKPDEYVFENGGTLSITVIPLVPFITGRRDGKSFKFFPVMRDAADLQISLYQDESALQHIKTMAGYPMLAANGMKPEKNADGKTNKKIGIGPMKVLYGTPDASGNHGTWTFIEPSATSMTFLQTSIDKTKQDLRELGRQPLTAQSGQLTVITTAVAAGKARSAVSAWALGLKDALENALVITALWLNLKDYQPEVNVFTEFDNFSDSNADLTTLDTARENGDLSQQTYWSELKRRKVLSPEFDADEERAQLLKEIPSDGINDDSIEPPVDKPPVVPAVKPVK